MGFCGGGGENTKFLHCLVPASRLEKKTFFCELWNFENMNLAKKCGIDDDFEITTKQHKSNI